MGKTPIFHSWWGRYFIPLLLFWVWYGWVGFPNAHVDDTLYAGTAVYHAQTGKMWNGMADGVLSIHQSYPYSPLHPLALSLWLRIFGISAASIVWFQALCGAITCWLGSLILTRLRIPCHYGYLILGAYVGYVIDLGFKPNALSTLAMTIGILFLLEDSWTSIMLGSLALSVSILVLPYTLVYAVTIMVGLLHHRLVLAPIEPFRKTATRYFTAFLVGGILSLLLLGVCLHFKFGVWLTEYARLAKVTPSPFNYNQWRESARLLWAVTLNGWNPFIYGGCLLVSLACLLSHLFTWKSVPPRAQLATVCFVLVMVLGFVIYIVQFIFSWPWICLAYAVFVLACQWPRLADHKLVWVTMAAILLITQSMNGLKVLFQREHNEAYHAAERELIHRRSPSAIYVDSNSWRYVFDCRIEPSFVANAFCFPPNLVRKDYYVALTSYRQAQPGSVLFLLSADYKFNMPDVNVSVTPLRVLGKTFNSIPLWKDEIIPFYYDGLALLPMGPE